MKKAKTLIAILCVCTAFMMLLGGTAVSAATEDEILNTIYQLEQEKMAEPHNGFSYWTYQTYDKQTVPSTYVEVDMFGTIDSWYAPDTTLAIIAYGWMHPSNECRPVLVWTAPYDGKINVYTKYSAVKDGDDTTEVSLYLNDERQWFNVTSTAEEEDNTVLEVKAGDQVKWTVDKIIDQTNDTTNMIQRVWYTEVNVNSGATTDGVTTADSTTANDTTANDTTANDTTAADTTTDVTTTDTAASTGADTTDKAPSAEKDGNGLLWIIIGAVAVVAVVAVIVVVKKKKN